MSNNDKKKIAKNYDYKKALKRKSDHSLMKKVGMTVVAANIMMAPLGQYIEHFSGHTGVENVAEAASLAEVQLLTDVAIDATLSPEDVAPADGEPYNLNLNLNGTGLADIELVNPDRTVVFHAPDLAG